MPSLLLDVRTVLLMLIIGNLVTVLIVFAYRSGQKRETQHIQFLIGTTMQVVCYVLFFLRGFAPDLLTVHLANSLMFFGFVIQGEAVIGRKYVARWMMAVMLGAVAFGIIGISLIASYSGERVIYASICMTVVFGVSTFAMLRSAKGSMLRKVLGSMYGLITLILVIRSASSMLNPGEYSLLGSNTIQSLIYGAIFLLMLLGCGGFPMLLKERDDQELMDAYRNLSEATTVAEAANRSKSDFLANMSHEIRTPMNAIIGMTYLVERTELTAKQRGYLSKIGVAAHSLLGIINDILDVSKIEAGKMELESNAFSLDETLRNLGDIVAGKLEQRDIEVIFSVAPSTPHRLIGDQLRLGQVLTNLLANAVKFTETGEIVVSVIPEEVIDQGIRLRFEVKDTGIGMTPEQVAGLFKPFSQADSSITRKYGGTGLGLTISKQLVEIMGGQIWADSEPGKGSVFAFTVTLGIDSEMPAPQTQACREALSGKRVLVVDDSETAREALAVMLDSNGLAVTTAASGPEALRTLEQADPPFDLVLMDWRMPGMDGIEASRHIKDDKTSSRIPAILMVTAFGRELLMSKAEQSHLDGFLVKPVAEQVLMDTIADLFDLGGLDGPAKEGRREAALSAQGRILLVEDNSLNRILAEELLGDMGFTVEIAVNGRMGVERALSEQFDLVLMDIQMPEMDGLTAARLIRADERLKDLPIIAMTAHAMSGDREKSLEAGMNDHITKPIDPAKLAEVIGQWIRFNRPGEIAARPMAPDSLPDTLPPFHMTAALARTNGKAKLLRTMIVGFHEEYAGTIPRLRKMIAEGETGEAERLVHSLKSIAWTLGAEELADIALKLEIAFREGGEQDTTTLLEALERALSPALASAASLMREACA